MPEARRLVRAARRHLALQNSPKPRTFAPGAGSTRDPWKTAAIEAAAETGISTRSVERALALERHLEARAKAPRAVTDSEAAPRTPASSRRHRKLAAMALPAKGRPIPKHGAGGDDSALETRFSRRDYLEFETEQARFFDQLHRPSPYAPLPMLKVRGQE